MLFELYNGGKFIANGNTKGKHPVRTLESDELIYVTGGVLTMFEEDSNFELPAGSWLLLRRNRRHGGIGNYPKHLKFFWWHFKALDDFLDRYPSSGMAINSSNVSNYLQNLLIEQSNVEPNKKIMELLFSLILHEILRPQAVADNETSATPLAQAAFNYLSINYMKNISLSSTAEVLQCNVEYLGRLFHKVYGTTFTAMLNRRRIEKAARLLANGEISIKAAAAECGFNDPAYFRRQFFHFYNQTPSEFRKKNLLGHRNTN